MGGENLCFGGPSGMMACGGDMALCRGCDPRMGVSWQLCQCKIPKFTSILIFIFKRQIKSKKSKKIMSIFPSIEYKTILFNKLYLELAC